MPIIRYMYRRTSLEIHCIPNSTKKKQNHLLLTWLLHLLSFWDCNSTNSYITCHLCQELQHRHTQNHIHLGKVCFILWACSPGSLDLNKIVLVDCHYPLPLLSLLANEPRLLLLGLLPPLWKLAIHVSVPSWLLPQNLWKLWWIKTFWLRTFYKFSLYPPISSKLANNGLRNKYVERFKLDTTLAQQRPFFLVKLPCPHK
jgi:hypothetical protein